MFVLRTILAAGSFTLISGAPVLSFLSNAVNTASTIQQRATANQYTVYGGTGALTDGWPSTSQWLSFDTMFSDNKGVLSSGCSQWGVAENSDSEIADIKSAITSVASSTGVDARFILAVVMQESNGCVRAPTTNYGVRNPGLMQSHDGSGTCNDGSVSNPCPASSITQMITDGTAGTAAGDGLKQCIAATGVTDASKYYMAARIYNSGSIDSSKNLGAGIATHCYATDIANRLCGWYSGTSACDPTTIASISGVSTVVTNDDTAVAAVASSASAPATTTAAAGGVFAAVSTPTTTSTPTPTPSTVAAEPVVESATPVVSDTPVVTSTPVVESAESVASTTPTTITVIPTPAASSDAVAPVRVSTDTSSGLIPVGEACTTEGLWNCISGSSFQQCASGTWSAVQNLAAGMKCVAGQSAVLDASAITE